jgi:hypothetical protein
LVKFATTEKLNPDLENKLLLDYSIKFTIERIPLYFLIIYLTYLSLCVLVFISKDTFVEIKSKEKRNLNRENLTDAELNELIYSIPVKTYVFSTRLKEIREFVSRDLYMDDKTYRLFFRNLMGTGMNSDIIAVFEGTVEKQKLFSSKVLASSIMVTLFVALLFLTNRLNIFFEGGSSLVNILWLCVLGFLLFEFFMLVSYIDSSRYLYGQLLTNRDQKFIDEENAKHFEIT